MRIEGLENVFRNLDLAQAVQYQKTLRAAKEIALLLEAYAKTHHGHGQRDARTLQKKYRRKGVVKTRTINVPAGEGWLRDTGDTDRSTRGFIASATIHAITVGLSAGMAYDVFLETARDGKWAWLLPAIQDNQVLIMQILAGAVTV